MMKSPTEEFQLSRTDTMQEQTCKWFYQNAGRKTRGRRDDSAAS